MGKHTITEAQIGEIAARLGQITRGGISDVACEHVVGIHAVLSSVVKETVDEKKVESGSADDN